MHSIVYLVALEPRYGSLLFYPSLYSTTSSVVQHRAIASDWEGRQGKVTCPYPLEERQLKGVVIHLELAMCQLLVPCHPTGSSQSSSYRESHFSDGETKVQRG